jgi:hypothetical protein
MKKLVRMGLILLGLALALTAAMAQDVPKADIAVSYSPLYILQGYTIWNNGGSGALAVNANRWLGFVGDFGVYHANVGQSLTGETYMVGPRFSLRIPDEPHLVPFAQALFGGSHFGVSTGGITGGGSEFTFSVGGGVDIVGWRGRFALRPQAEYVGIRSGGSTTPALRLGIGIVYRIGGR